jgi:hypothetical protein
MMEKIRKIVHCSWFIVHGSGLPRFLFKRKGRKVWRKGRKGSAILRHTPRNPQHATRNTDYRLPDFNRLPSSFVSFVPFLCALCGEFFRISTG